MSGQPERLSIESLCYAVTSGGTPSRANPQFWEGGTIPWFKTGELKDCYIDDAEERITEAGLLGSSAKIFPSNTVLMAMYGDGKTITSLGILRADAATNQACCAMTADSSKCNFRYLFYALKYHRHELLKLVVAGAQRNLSTGIIRKFRILAPSLPIQDRIATILSTYDDLIENNRRRITLLEQAARHLYEEWFVRLKFPGHERTRIVNGVPEGWRKGSAFDAMNVMSGGTPKTTNSDFWDGDIPFYTPKDSVENFYVLDTEKHLTELGLNTCNSKLYPKDTVFITARGTVGNINLAQKPMAMNQSCYALAGREDLTQKFLFCALRAAVQHFQQHAVGAVFDAIVVDTFKLIPFIRPESRLVQAFTDAIDPMVEQIENLSQQNQKLRTARDLLLPRLMSGEIAV